MQVFIAPRAQRDITTAVQWWRANRPLAQNWLEAELRAAVRKLSEQPFGGAPAVDVRLAGIRRRALLATRYFIYYRVNEPLQRVEVLRFWHMSRNRPPRLK